MSELIRDETLRDAVAFGLMPEDIAREFDDWSDALAARIVAGEITQDAADRLTFERAMADAKRARNQGWPKGGAAEELKLLEKLFGEKQGQH